MRSTLLSESKHQVLYAISMYKEIFLSRDRSAQREFSLRVSVFFHSRALWTDRSREKRVILSASIRLLDSDKSVERTTFTQPLHIDKEIFLLPQVGLEPPTMGFELITPKIGGECSTYVATKSSCRILRLTWIL